FFFNDTATTEIYTLSLHDALPISTIRQNNVTQISERDATISGSQEESDAAEIGRAHVLNSSHVRISYAVFCLKKKKKKKKTIKKKKKKKKKTNKKPTQKQK